MILLFQEGENPRSAATTAARTRSGAGGLPQFLQGLLPFGDVAEEDLPRDSFAETDRFEAVDNFLFIH